MLNFQFQPLGIEKRRFIITRFSAYSSATGYSMSPSLNAFCYFEDHADSFYGLQKWRTTYRFWKKCTKSREVWLGSLCMDYSPIGASKKHFQWNFMSPMDPKNGNASYSNWACSRILDLFVKCDVLSVSARAENDMVNHCKSVWNPMQWWWFEIILALFPNEKACLRFLHHLTIHFKMTLMHLLQISFISWEVLVTFSGSSKMLLKKPADPIRNINWYYF